VQSLHFDTPFQAKIRKGPRARLGALKPRAAGEILLAEVYPSEKYRCEKVRKYNRIILAPYSIFVVFSPK